MTQEEELLWKDFCAMLPYGAKNCVNNNVEHLNDISILNNVEECSSFLFYDIEKCKSYSFLLPSISEKQINELFSEFIKNNIDSNDFNNYSSAGEYWHTILQLYMTSHH